MSRSNHHGCGKTCYLCKPHKLTGEPKPSVARQLQDTPPTEDLHPAEERLIEHDAFEAERKRVQALPRDDVKLASFGTRCADVIPGTFIMCGEGGNYCSDECMKAAEEK